MPSATKGMPVRVETRPAASRSGHGPPRRGVRVKFVGLCPRSGVRVKRISLMAPHTRATQMKNPSSTSRSDLLIVDISRVCIGKVLLNSYIIANTSIRLFNRCCLHIISGTSTSTVPGRTLDAAYHELIYHRSTRDCS